MATVSKVTLHRAQKCTKCKGDLGVGEIVVKDRSNHKKVGTLYYHTKCPKNK
jgi:hypothetical protein